MLKGTPRYVSLGKGTKVQMDHVVNSFKWSNHAQWHILKTTSLQVETDIHLKRREGQRGKKRLLC